MKLALVVLILSTLNLHAQDAECHSSGDSSECHVERPDGSEYSVHTFCSGDTCDSYSTESSPEQVSSLRNYIAETKVNPEFHANVLCGANDFTYMMFPNLIILDNPGWRNNPIRPSFLSAEDTRNHCRKSLSFGMEYQPSPTQGFLEYERIVKELCAIKNLEAGRLDAKQCAILEHDVNAMRPQYDAEQKEKEENAKRAAAKKTFIGP